MVLVKSLKLFNLFILGKIGKQNKNIVFKTGKIAFVQRG